MRIVLDTNVLVSAYVFPGGKPEEVYRLVLQGSIEHVTSTPLLAELGRALQEKFAWDAARTEAAVAQVVRISTLIDIKERISVVREDPDDDRVLETAVNGRATHIVSGDRHLLTLGTFRELRIVSPAAFVEMVARQ